MHNQLNLYYKTMLIKKFIISYVLIISSCKNDIIRIIMDTEYGPILLGLYPKQAPITVKNFLNHIDDNIIMNFIFIEQ